MAERKGGDGSFREAVGEVLRPPIEFALEQREIGSRLQNTALIASLLAVEALSLVNVVQKEVIVPQDFLPVVGLNAALYIAMGLLFYAREHHLRGPFIG